MRLFLSRWFSVGNWSSCALTALVGDLSLIAIQDTYIEAKWRELEWRKKDGNGNSANSDHII